MPGIMIIFGDTTHPVGQKEPNAWGLYDMQGNLSEWVGDIEGNYSVLPVSDPKASLAGTMSLARGCSWYNFAVDCQSALRYWAPTDVRSAAISFRLALSVG
jgi:formylglycine-generating enzyme required for sulfatase activity